MLPFKTDWMIYDLIRILHKQQFWEVCKELFIVVSCTEAHLVYIGVVGLGCFFSKKYGFLRKQKEFFL